MEHFVFTARVIGGNARGPPDQRPAGAHDQTTERLHLRWSSGWNKRIETAGTSQLIDFEVG